MTNVATKMSRGESPATLEPEFDQGRHPRARIGFVLLPSEVVIEQDMFAMAPAGVGVHFSRAQMPEGVTVANLAAMKAGLSDAAALLMPGFKVDVVCYACTSGSIVMGEDAVVSELLRARPDRKATTLVTGCVEALRKIGARRIVIGTPYINEVNEQVAAFFTKKGFEVLTIEGLGLLYDNDISRVTPAFLTKFAQAIDSPSADAIFISCGALRAVDALEAIEQKTGKPAISSNQAMLWHCLRKAGIADKFGGYGSLFREY
jgi:maleate isomerase